MFIPAALPPQTAVSFTDSFTNWSASAALPLPSEITPLLKETWDLQTFANLQEGRVAVPDDAVNAYLAEALKEQTEVSELSIRSHADQTIAIHAKTASIGRIELICQLEQFEHNASQTQLRLRVKDKKLPDHPVLSWMFARVSLALATKLTGPIEPGHGVKVTVKGNQVSVDLREALLSSSFGRINVFGWQPVNALEIKSALPCDGYLLLNTSLEIPENISKLVTAFLR